MYAIHSTRIVAVAVAAVWIAVPVSGADIALRQQATPQSTIVRLGDVAEVRADDKQEAQKLAAMPLMPSPAPGTQRFIRMREVQDLLAAQGADINRLNFRGELVVEVAAPEAQAQPADAAPDANKVVQASATASPATIVGDRHRAAWKGEAVIKELANLTDDDAATMRTLVNDLIVDYLNRSAGQKSPWKLKYELPNRSLEQLAAATGPCKCAGGSAPWTGKQRFVVSFPTARGDIEFGVLSQVTLPQPIVVSTRAIERGAVVTAADLEVQQVEDLPTNGRRTTFDSTEKLIGMEATKGIQVGDTIYDDAVRPPLLVKRGDQVAVYARGGGIQVRTVARARQDGARGELVQMESLDTKERYDAVVVGSREAVVFAGSAAPTPEIVERPSRTFRR